MINVLSKVNLSFKSYNKCFYKLSCCNYSCLLYEKKIENKCKIVGNIGQQSVRFNFSLPNPFRKKQSFRNIDQIPAHFQCVYVSPMGLYMAYFYPISVIFGGLTSVAAVCAIFMDIKSVMHLVGEALDATMHSRAEFEKVHFATMGTVSSTFAFLIWILARRTPLRIYYDEDEEVFVASFASMRPWKTINITFEPGDVTEKYPSDENTPVWSPKIFLGQYLLFKKRRIILFRDSFRLPYYYNLVLGIHLQALSKEDPPY